MPSSVVTHASSWRESPTEARETIERFRALMREHRPNMPEQQLDAEILRMRGYPYTRARNAVSSVLLDLARGRTHRDSVGLLWWLICHPEASLAEGAVANLDEVDRLLAEARAAREAAERDPDAPTPEELERRRLAAEAYEKEWEQDIAYYRSLQAQAKAKAEGTP